jgi:ferric-dicitrate binding protein FerR (iron transport regulator)
MKMTKEDFEALFDKYLNDKASPAEIKLLDQFFDSYRNQAGDLDEISKAIKGEILQNIHISIDRNKKISARYAPAVWLRAAAVISFFLLASYFLYGRFSEPKVTQRLVAKLKVVRALKGQKLDIRLSDGSRIRLNANSRISYPEKFTDEIREVSLEGEAYFEVAHLASSPFIVHTRHANTKVLGTSFNVLSADEATSVTLVEGKVNVYMPNGQTATLTPNRQATIVRGSHRIDTQDVDVEQFVGWKDNTLHFNDVTVKEAFSIIENWYNVKIDVKDPGLMNCVITSKYQNESLENVLNSFRFMLKMDFTIDGQRIIVTGKGCP